jgi:hypothetical protein
MGMRMRIAALTAGMLLPLSVVQAPAMAQSAAAKAPITDLQPLPKGKAGKEQSVDPSRRACTCPRGWFCVWPRTNCRGQRHGGNRSNRCYVGPVKRSAVNTMGHGIRLYTGARCTGRYGVLPNRRWTNFTFRSVGT